MNISIWKIAKKDFIKKGMFDNYKAHQLVSKIFDESVQFDIQNKESVVDILIYSNNNITQQPTFGTIKTKSFEPVFETTTYKLEVNANIVKSIWDGKKCKKIPLISEKDVFHYFQARQEEFGFSVTNIQSAGSSNHIFFKNDSKITTTANKLSILCDVLCPEKFKQTVFSGIGSQKKFGFGLIKVYKPT